MPDRLNSTERGASQLETLRGVFRELVGGLYLTGISFRGHDKNIARQALLEKHPEIKALMVELIRLRKVEIPQGANEYQIPPREVEVMAQLKKFAEDPNVDFSGANFSSEFRNPGEYTAMYNSIKRNGAATRLAYDANTGGGGFPTFPHKFLR